MARLFFLPPPALRNRDRVRICDSWWQKAKENGRCARPGRAHSVERGPQPGRPCPQPARSAPSAAATRPHRERRSPVRRSRGDTPRAGRRAAVSGEIRPLPLGDFPGAFQRPGRARGSRSGWPRGQPPGLSPPCPAGRPGWRAVPRA